MPYFYTTTTVTLSAELLSKLKKMVHRVGERQACQAINISRWTLTRAIAGFKLRAISVERIRLTLEPPTEIKAAV